MRPFYQQFGPTGRRLAAHLDRLCETLTRFGAQLREAVTRAVGEAAAGDASKELVGRVGQTSTQVVIMTDPPESYTIVPLGASDHKESGHWDDQAEKLFSKSKAVRTYFLNRDELLKHVTAKKVLTCN